jgi:hypothetical protein
MGIDVRWEDESGKLIEEISDPNDYFGLLLNSSSLNETVCLRFIDPYGDTILNQEQIPVFIAELQSLLKSINKPANLNQAKEHIIKIINLANRSRAKGHTYLKFYGD